MAQQHATRIYPSIKAFLGSTYGGAWFDAEAQKLVVATTNQKNLPWIEVTGAEAALVDHSLGELRAFSATLTDLLGTGISASTSGPFGIRIDYQSNRLIVELSTADLANAWAEIALEQFSEIPVEWSVYEGERRFFSTLNGGDAIRNPDLIVGGSAQPCSVGFGVEGGFLTAAHCGWVPHAAENGTGSSLGAFSASSFPPEISWIDDPSTGLEIKVSQDNSDHSFVATSGGWLSTDRVGDGANEVRVEGSIEMPVGVVVCRYGATTGGPHCGTILSKDYSLTFFTTWFSNLYPGSHPIAVPLTGLMLTDACAGNGDSGGPLIWYDAATDTAHAQGLLTGGNEEAENCSSPSPLALTWYAPVNRALDEMDLTLLTAPSGPPIPICPWCPPPYFGPKPLPFSGVSNAEIECQWKPARDRWKRLVYCSAPVALADESVLQWRGLKDGLPALNGYYGVCETGSTYEIELVFGDREMQAISSASFDCY